MSDHIDTEAVREGLDVAGWGVEELTNLAADLCDELDRTREASEGVIKAWTEKRRDHRVVMQDAIAALRAALAEGDTERPERCPRCGSNRRDVCKINADPALSCWAIDPHPWHRATDTDRCWSSWPDLGAEEQNR